MSHMHLWNSHELVEAQLHELPKKLKSNNKKKRAQYCRGTGKRRAIQNKGQKIVAAQLDGHRFKMKGVSVSRKRPPDGGGTSIFTQNRA